MESYIQISHLNDFIFCPKSIYFHKLYGKYNQSLYHETPQTEGKIKHESIDQKTYSSAKRYIQSLEIYSEKYNLCGKIDIYDAQTKSLIERKNKITTIYDGYKYQLFAQYFCLREMGYKVEKLFFHSLTDNKRYSIPLPNLDDITAFEFLLQQFKTFNIADPNFTQNPHKCARCIYKDLCDSYTPLPITEKPVIQIGEKRKMTKERKQTLTKKYAFTS